MNPLPIDEIIPKLLQTISTHSNTLLHAPPGAGKTTRVPLALLECMPPTAGRIVMLEPRRLAAVSAARWMARLLGEEAGGTIGYTIRFDSNVSAKTRVEIVTEGILTRRIQNDPLLEGVGMVIFDEFHERSIHADLGLALCLDVQRQVRPDLKILVMSATLDLEPLSRLLNAPVVASAGRSFPVEEVFLEQPPGPLPGRMAAAIKQALNEREGDVLAFLPGAGEIRSCASRLAEAGLGNIHQLYGDLPFEEQQRAILPGKGRKIVLATSIAETSLTIEGVRVVIDSGLSRRMRHDPASGMNRLVTVRESRSSAEQRRGRAGRLGPGVCYRLFSRHTFSAMTPHTPPEILDTDLSPLLLELAAWGVADPSGLAWLDPPPDAAVSVARRLLILLSALDEGGMITPLGSAMARLPLHPRLARMLLRGDEAGCLGLGCDLAALLSERDIFRQRGRGVPQHIGDSDLADRLELLAGRRKGGMDHGDTLLDAAAVATVERSARQLRRLMSVTVGKEAVIASGDAINRLLLAAYPDRLARLRDTGEGRYLLANGGGARLAPASSVRNARFLIAASVAGGDQAEGVIHMAAAVDEELVRQECPAMITTKNEIVWNEREGRAVASREERVGAVRLSSAPCRPSGDELIGVIVAAVRGANLGLLTMNGAVRQLQGRVALLRRAMPEEGWPDMSGARLLETLEEWLTPFLEGVRTSQQLGLLDVADILRNSLDYRRQRALDELAPTHIVVPSGSRIGIDYTAGEIPVLGVKLQELFGLADTPAIAGGRVELLLHLLSPAGRPIQVTRDLKGFWNGAYHEVKKELKGRYPRHPWPDDPWSAVPTRRAKPRSR